MVGVRMPGRCAAPGCDTTTLPGTARSVDYPAGNALDRGPEARFAGGAVSAKACGEYAKRLAGITW